VRCMGIRAGHGARAVTRGRARAAMLAGMRSCSRCATRLSPLARIDARFCSTRCRVAAHRAKPAPTFPVELEDADRWIRYSPTKVPLTVDGRAASSTDASTWSSHAEAMGSSVGAGPGFVLNGDGIVCIDLDHCLVDGVLEPWAQEIVDMVPATYIEVSPSGDGLHVWGRGELARGRRIGVDGGFVEAYATARYLTVTRDAWTGSVGTLGRLDRVFRALGI
jgi:hypothetical protein